MTGLAFGRTLLLAFLVTVFVECKSKKPKFRVELDKNGNLKF